MASAKKASWKTPLKVAPVRTGAIRPIDDNDAKDFAAHYLRAVASGAIEAGMPVGTGKQSAITAAANSLGLKRMAAKRRYEIARKKGFLSIPISAPSKGAAETVPLEGLKDELLAMLRARPFSMEEMMASTGTTQAKLKTAIHDMRGTGARIKKDGDTFFLDRTPFPEARLSGPLQTVYTESDNTFTFGACGDQHIASKYYRPEVMEALYDAYAEAGCSAVFNTGNWIDGDASFNKHDLLVHGIDRQIEMLSNEYPKRKGITTYAVTGDDHEGWYSQREGIDVGLYAANKFREKGRNDWIDLGYMEAPVRLVNKNTGKTAIIAVVHPGGGSSYALSYAIQKIVESLDGGEKPDIGLYGHYHKLWFGNIRNVWCAQTGTAQDQTPFMRKKKLEAHVGGQLLKVTQDPATGALVRCSSEIMRYFNRGYYSNRWSHHGEVTMAERVGAGVRT